jgi:biopolymer transport protein ExbB/TolQ
MFVSADIIVKAVMLGLIFASVLTWTIWLAKTLQLFDIRRRIKRAQYLPGAARSVVDAAAAAKASPHVALLIRAVGSRTRPLLRSPRHRRHQGAHHGAVRTHRGWRRPQDDACNRNSRDH